MGKFSSALQELFFTRPSEPQKSRFSFRLRKVIFTRRSRPWWQGEWGPQDPVTGSKYFSGGFFSCYSINTWGPRRQTILSCLTTFLLSGHTPTNYCQTVSFMPKSVNTVPVSQVDFPISLPWFTPYMINHSSSHGEFDIFLSTSLWSHPPKQNHDLSKIMIGTKTVFVFIGAMTVIKLLLLCRAETLTYITLQMSRDDTIEKQGLWHHMLTVHVGMGCQSHDPWRPTVMASPGCVA